MKSESMKVQDKEKPSPSPSKQQKTPLISVMSDVSQSEVSEVKLSVDPDQAKFSRIGSCKSDHMIVNFTEQRMALKAKCSNNADYRVDPVMQFIEPNKCRNLQITRLPTAVSQKKDKVLIVYSECDEKTTDLKAFFKTVEGSKKSNFLKITLDVVDNVNNNNNIS